MWPDVSGRIEPLVVRHACLDCLRSAHPYAVRHQTLPGPSSRDKVQQVQPLLHPYRDMSPAPRPGQTDGEPPLGVPGGTPSAVRPSDRANRSEYLVRHDLAGALIDTVAILAGQATLTSGQGSGTNMSIEVMPVPFSPAPAASAGGRVAATTGRYYEFSLHSPVGDLERIVRLAEEPPVRTDAHLEAWVRGSARDRESPEDTRVEAALRRYEEMPWPERLPAWNSLLIADSREIWAWRFTILGAETIHWDVFGPDGSLLGRVRFSADLRIQHIGEGRLTVVPSDDLGVERVEVYELR